MLLSFTKEVPSSDGQNTDIQRTTPKNKMTTPKNNIPHKYYIVCLLLFWNH